MRSIQRSFFALFTLSAIFTSVLSLTAFAQSRPQRPEPLKGNNKINQRPTPKTEEELKKEADQRKIEEEEKNAIVDTEILKVDTNIVNVDAVVFNKKTGQIVTGLKKENFAVFENGIKQEVAQFSTP